MSSRSSFLIAIYKNKTMSTQKMFRRDNPYFFVLALVLGATGAVAGSVFATTIGNNVSISGNVTTSGTAASSSISYALGVGTTTPAMMFSVGGAGGDATGHGYFTGGVGIGSVSTTTAGALQISGVAQFGGALHVAGVTSLNGNVTLGDASTDTLTINANSITYGNVGTTTLPSASAVAWAVATSSANIPFMRYDTSSYRIGIGTTTPGATFSVAGTLYGTGNAVFDSVVTFNGTSTIITNAASTTIVSANANAWAIATTSANVPFVKFDTSNYRIGIGTTTPGATFSVAGTDYVISTSTVDGGVVWNGSNHVITNNATTTIATNANAYALATSSALIPFVKYDASNYRVGIGTSTPGLTLAVAGTAYVTGSSTFDGGITWNGSNHVITNVATTTIPSANANAYAIATSTASIPFVKYDTSAFRVGIGTTTPGATLAIAGSGDILVAGSGTSTLKLAPTGTSRGGCIEFLSPTGTVLRLYATTTGLAVFESGQCK